MLETSVMKEESVDLLIVGSGPVGATYARELLRLRPEARILLVDAGPQLTQRRGFHVRNIPDMEARAVAQVSSQGPTAFAYETPTMAQRAEAENAAGTKRSGLLARPGTFLLENDGAGPDMPAAAMSSNVGGMGSHWTCACPRPGGRERIDFIPAAEWDELCVRAEELLHVTSKAFPNNAIQQSILDALASEFRSGASTARPVASMPLACTVQPDGDRVWSGPDVVLGPLAEAESSPPNFELRANTVCLRLDLDGSRASGAVLHDRLTGEGSRVLAKAFVVAADALRTPQLLWASGIRLRALGHYLNDQPISMALVRVSLSAGKTKELDLQANTEQGTFRPNVDATLGVLWVPYEDEVHPFHGQVMHLDSSPIPVKRTDPGGDRGKYVGLGWFTAKEVRFEDWIEFSETEKDFYGMPKMTIHYELTERDLDQIERSQKMQARAAAAIGEFVEGALPKTVPAGTSLHYQGSTRMGEADDGESVCNPDSLVWGLRNVFVGGNGVIPTSTACNPTLSAVALAVRSSRRVAELL